MKRNIILKQDPKVEFQFEENGFHLLDAQSENNNGYFAYEALQSISLEYAWYPRFAKFMRLFTWLMNGVPFFPDGESSKKANLTIHLENMKLGIWLTDPKMTSKAKSIKGILEKHL